MENLSVLNDDNKLVINDKYKNLSMTRKVLLQKTAIGEDHFRIKLRDGEYAIGFGTKGNKEFSVFPYRNGDIFFVEIGVGNPAEITAYVFGLQHEVATNEKYGLKVFDENGEEVFDSSKKYMRVLFCDNKMMKYDIPAGMDVAVVPLSTETYESSTPETHSICEIIQRTAGNHVYEDMVVGDDLEKSRYEDGDDEYENVTGSYQFMVIDVTDY